MLGKSGKEAFSWGNVRGGAIWLASEETLAGNRNGKSRNSKRPSPKRPDFFKIGISNRL